MRGNVKGFSLGVLGEDGFEGFYLWRMGKCFAWRSDLEGFCKPEGGDDLDLVLFCEGENQRRRERYPSANGYPNLIF